MSLLSLCVTRLSIKLGLNCVYAKCKFGVKKYRVFTVAVHATLKLTLNCLYSKFKFGLKAPLPILYKKV